jgi:hypothetical protein
MEPVPNRAEHPNRKIGDHTTPMVEKTNSAGGSRFQAPASEEAKNIGNSWRNTPAHRYAHEAVVWTQSGNRVTGTHVTPATHPKTGESGINLHTLNTGTTFHKDSDVHEVHFVEKPGMPDSATREEMYRKEQSKRNQTVE